MHIYAIYTVHIRNTKQLVCIVVIHMPQLHQNLLRPSMSSNEQTKSARTQQHPFQDKGSVSDLFCPFLFPWSCLPFLSPSYFQLQAIRAAQHLTFVSSPSLSWILQLQCHLYRHSHSHRYYSHFLHHWRTDQPGNMKMPHCCTQSLQRKNKIILLGGSQNWIYSHDSFCKYYIHIRTW